jgi:diaminobutyrate-2-oxoglutarate transaminase
VQELAHENGALLIFDDIQAACGRTGSYFSFDGMDSFPGYHLPGQGLGGYGTPLAMNLINPEHDRLWKPGEHTGTFRGQGLSFVAGAEAMSYIEDHGFMDDVKRKGAVMRERLKSLVPADAGPEIAVRGKGMIQGLDVGDGEKAGAIAGACFDRGLLIGPCGTGGRVLKLIPPLTIPTRIFPKGSASSRMSSTGLQEK